MKVATGATTIGMATLAGCAGEESSDSASGDTGGGGETTTDGGSAETSTSATTQAQAQATTKAEQTEQQTPDSQPTATEEKGLRLLEHEFYEEEYSAGVKGVAINETGSTLDYVGVEVVFLNAEKTQIGDSLDNTTDLKNGRKWKFDAPFLGSEPGTVDSYEIEISDSPLN